MAELKSKGLVGINQLYGGGWCSEQRKHQVQRPALGWYREATGPRVAPAQLGEWG